MPYDPEPIHLPDLYKQYLAATRQPVAAAILYLVDALLFIADPRDDDPEANDQPAT